MKLLAAVATALLADAVLASPVVLTPRASRAAKRSSLRRTRPRMASDTNGVLAVGGAGAGNGTADVSYSGNWAGAVLVGSGYQAVYGTFTVPTPKEPSGGKASTAYSASAWVGIDGDTCSSAILQTGVDFNVQGGSVSFDAWYEWYPDYAYTFEGFDISAGDVIALTAAASSTTAGSVVIENLTTGQSVSHSFTGQSGELCETNAEWIVEDFEQNGSLVPFCDFGSVTFTNASVTLTSGETIGADGATIIDLRQSGKVLTSCSAESDSVTCDYV